MTQLVLFLHFGKLSSPHETVCETNVCRASANKCMSVTDRPSIIII